MNSGGETASKWIIAMAVPKKTIEIDNTPVNGTYLIHARGSSGLERWLVHDRTVLAGFESHCGKLRFGTLAIPFTPLCQCLSEETLKAVGPFYLVSMPGEVKDPTSPHWNV